MKFKYEENVRTELKEDFNEQTKEPIFKTIRAFNNTEGGTIYIGVRNDGEIIGINNEKVDKYQQHIFQYVNDTLKKTSTISIDIEIHDYKNIIVVKVLPSEKIWEGNNKLAVRIGSSTKELKSNEIERFLLKIDNYKEKINKRFKEDFNLLGYIDWDFSKEENINKMNKIYEALIYLKHKLNQTTYINNFVIDGVDNFSFYENTIFFDIDFKISLETLNNPIKVSVMHYVSTIRYKITNLFDFEEYATLLYQSKKNLSWHKDLEILEKSIRNHSNIRNDSLTIFSMQLQAKINNAVKIFNENLNDTSNKFLDIINNYINKKTL